MSLAQVFGGQGNQLLGMAVAVGAREALTCAHVINQSLSRPIGEPSAPPSKAAVTLEFPFHPQQPTRRAHVVRWAAPVADRSFGDLAALEFPEPLPDDLPIPDFSPGSPEPETAVRVFGYPLAPRREEGYWAQATVRGQLPSGAIQLDPPVADAGIGLQPGFSGSPVLDAATGEIHGILYVAGRVASAYGDAYAIPTAWLSRFWPERFGGLDIASNPYLGLRPFTLDDQDLFYGRSAEVDKLTELVLGSRAVIVIGASGVGKSSLIQAGLLPRLMKQINADVAVFRPGQDPWGELAQSLLRAEGNLDAAADFEAVQARARRVQRDGLRRLAAFLHSQGRPLCVVADQFEEYLLAAEDADFVEALLPDLDLPTSHRLVLAVRTDFLDSLLRIPRLGQRVDSFTVSPLSREQLLVAISGPARRRNVELEEGLTAQIAEDGARGALPFVEFTLTELWPLQRDRTLTFSAYRRIGGVSGALDQVAEEHVRAVGLADDPALERVLLRLVVSSKSRVARRQLRRSEVSPSDWDILYRLSKGPIVIIDTVLGGAGNRQPYAELAHEQLVDGWRRLNRIITENETFLSWLAYVEDRRREGDLLSVPRVDEAVVWLEQRAHDIPEDVRVFVERSTAAVRQQQERQRARAFAAAAELQEDPQVALLLATEALLLADEPANDRRVRNFLMQCKITAIEPYTGPLPERADGLERVTITDWSQGPPGGSWSFGTPAAWQLSGAGDLVCHLPSSVGVAIEMPGPVVVAAHSTQAGATCAATESGHFAWIRARHGVPHVVHCDAGVPVVAVAIAADGSMAAVAGDDGSVRVVALAEPLPPFTVLDSGRGLITDVDIYPEAGYLAAITQSRMLLVWELASSKLWRSVPLGPGIPLPPIDELPRVVLKVGMDWALLGRAPSQKRVPLSSAALVEFMRRAAPRHMNAEEIAALAIDSGLLDAPPTPTNNS